MRKSDQGVRIKGGTVHRVTSHKSRRLNTHTTSSFTVCFVHCLTQEIQNLLEVTTQAPTVGVA